MASSTGYFALAGTLGGATIAALASGLRARGDTARLKLQARQSRSQADLADLRTILEEATVAVSCLEAAVDSANRAAVEHAEIRSADKANAVNERRKAAHLFAEQLGAQEIRLGLRYGPESSLASAIRAIRNAAVTELSGQSEKGRAKQLSKAFFELAAEQVRQTYVTRPHDHPSTSDLD